MDRSDERGKVLVGRALCAVALLFCVPVGVLFVSRTSQIASAFTPKRAPHLAAHAGYLPPQPPARCGILHDRTIEPGWCPADPGVYGALLPKLGLVLSQNRTTPPSVKPPAAPR